MSEIDWDKPPTRLETAMEKSRQTGLPIVRQDSVMAPAYQAPPDTSALPALGGLVGGVAGGVLLKNPWAGARAGQALVGSLLPSLAGSTVGTALGTSAEQVLAGQDILSTEGGKQMLSNLIENAAWDVGGNLVFSLGGKAYRVGKDAVSKFRGGMLSDEEAARRAAQEWLSQRGATLTKGQLTGDIGTQAIEGTLKYTSGAEAFAKQEAGVKKAIQQGAQDVLNTLDTSDAFQMALKQGDPTQMAVGDRFKGEIGRAHV